MTLVTLRPSATLSNTGTVTGAGSAANALDDDTDASYVTFVGGTGASFTLDDLALPAGAVMKNVSVRVRLAEAGVGSLLQALAQTGNFADVGGSAQPPSSSPSTITVGNFVTGWTDWAANDATLALDVPFLAGGEAVNVYEVYFDVIYVAKPVVAVHELGT